MEDNSRRREVGALVLPRKRLPPRPLTPDELKVFYVTREELPAFAADPLREERLGWFDVIVCRMPSCGRKLQKLPQHLIAKHREELSISDADTPKMLDEEYRRRFGYNKSAPLCCKSLQEKLSKNMKTQIARRKFQGRPIVRGFRKGRAPIQAAMQARKKWGISQQARQRMSASRINRPRPALRKKSTSGKTVSDWRIAKLRLEGKEASEIARKVSPPLTPSAVRGRFHRIGFPPGKPCLLFRGEAVTEKLLLAHFEDSKFLRASKPLIFRTQTQRNGDQDAPLSAAQAAGFLGVSKSWIYERMRSSSKDQIPCSRSGRGVLTFNPGELLQWALGRRNGKNRFLTTLGVEEELARRLGISEFRVYEFVVRPGGPRSPRNGMPRKSGHPLSRDLARALLSSIESLRQEYRQSGSTAKGGRPKALLPSEEKGLPGKYRALKADLRLMLSWAGREMDVITPDRLGEWMCQQRRSGDLRVVLFWPSLHSDLLEACERVRNRAHGGRLGFAERAKEILSKEYRLSPTQLDRITLTQPAHPQSSQDVSIHPKT